MEATVERKAKGRHGLLRTEKQRTSVGPRFAAGEQRSLKALVEKWREVGAVLPIAVVTSIVDDLLSHAEERANASPRRELTMNDIVIDHQGRARIDAQEGTGTVGQIAILLAKLIAGNGDDELPSSARPFWCRLADRAVMDADQLRTWMREALGSPSDRAEVAECFVEHTVAPNLTEVDIAATEVVEMNAIDRGGPTSIDEARPFCVPDAVAVEVLSAIEYSASDLLDTLPPQPPPLPPPPLPARPVIRVEWKRESAAVSVAPAARRSARPSHDGRDTLGIPGERGLWLTWTIVAILAFTVAVLWLRFR